MPIDDDKLEQYIKAWTESTRDILVRGWTPEERRSRTEQLRRRRRRARIRGLVVGLVVCAAVFFIVRYLAG